MVKKNARQAAVKPETLIVFEGPGALMEWGSAVEQCEYGYLSPGGAASMLRVSRQAVHEIVYRGAVRAWAVMERPDVLVGLASMDFGKRLTYMAIDFDDLVRYAVRTGRLTENDPIPFAASYPSARVKEFAASLDNNQVVL